MCRFCKSDNDAFFICKPCFWKLKGDYEHGIRIETPPVEGARFPLGKIVLTWGAIDGLEEARQLPTIMLGRHAKGEWGALLCEDDQARNEEAIQHGDRILSKYADLTGRHYYVITEHDRSVTTVLLPEEY